MLSTGKSEGRYLKLFYLTNGVILYTLMRLSL
jgi:hypothetical protein